MRKSYGIGTYIAVRVHKQSVTSGEKKIRRDIKCRRRPVSAFMIIIVINNIIILSARDRWERYNIILVNGT